MAARMHLESMQQRGEMRMRERVLLISVAFGSILLVVAAQERDSPDPTFLAHNDVTAGAELYRMYCATCHGIDGRGDGPAAEAMKRPPSDLTTIAKRNGGKFPDFRVTHIIDGYEVTAAHGSRDMPVWGDFFHDMKRDDESLKLREHNLTEYIRSIQR